MAFVAHLGRDCVDGIAQKVYDGTIMKEMQDAAAYVRRIGSVDSLEPLGFVCLAPFPLPGLTVLVFPDICTGGCPEVHHALGAACLWHVHTRLQRECSLDCEIVDGQGVHPSPILHGQLV